MEQNTYAWFKGQMMHLITIINRQIELNQGIEYDNQNTEILIKLLERLSHENLKVLIMGTFSSGKSTFINALLGRRILPAKALPTTACICKIRFNSQIKCTLHPRGNHYVEKVTGKLHTGPFEIDLSRLKDYIVINDDQNSGEGPSVNDELFSPFELMDLEWPLGICKDGVEIVDSPGLNDPNSHDTITLEYLPGTDAIIYCMSCMCAFTATDKQIIEDLVQMGYKSIIFILTNFDLIQNTEEKAEFVTRRTQQLQKYTSLGSSGVLFVNSLGGVIGKEGNNYEEIDQSNILQAEKRIEDFLITHKGKTKLVRAESQIKVQNATVDQFITNKLKLNSLTLNELEQKHEQLTQILNSAKTKSDLILKTIQLIINDIVTKAAEKERVFLNSLETKLEEWLNDYKPSSSISIVPWKIKKTVTVYVNEYIDHIKYKLKLETNSWVNDQLNPMIIESINEIHLTTAELQDSYQNLMADYQMVINRNTTGDLVDEGEIPSISQFGELLNDFVNGDFIDSKMGDEFGHKGGMSMVITQIVALVTLGIIAFMTPIAFIGFVILSLVTAIATGVWNIDVIPDLVKQTILQNLKAELEKSEKKEAMITELKINISKELNKIIYKAKDLFDNDILPKEKAVNDALALRKKGEAEVEVENNKLLEAKSTNSQIHTEIEQLSNIIHI